MSEPERPHGATEASQEATPAESLPKILVLANPRMKRTGSITEPLKASLPAHCVIQAVDGPAAMADRARRAAEEGYARVVVAGGDGTVGIVVRALIDSELPLGIIPMGATNRFAYALGIPGDVKAACELAVSGTPRAIDLGCVISKNPDTSFVFKDSVRVGFLLNQGSGGPSVPQGLLTRTVMAVWQTLLAGRILQMHCRFDGNRREEACAHLTVAKLPPAGPEGAAFRETRVDDGALSVQMSVWRSALASLGQLPQRLRSSAEAQDGSNLLQALPVRKVRRIHVRGNWFVRWIFPWSVQMQADADYYCRLPADLEVRPGALNVVAPRS